MNIRMIVVDSGSLTTGETALTSILTGAGHSVSHRTASLSQDVGTADLIIIAATVAIANLGTKYRDSGIGTIVFAPDVVRNTGNGGWGLTNTITTAQTGGTFVTATGNFYLSSGSQTIYSASANQYSTAVAGGTVVAYRTNSGSNRHIVLWDDAEAAHQFTTSNRIFWWGWTDTNAGLLNTLGLDLLHAAITWTANISGGATSQKAYVEALLDAGTWTDHNGNTADLVTPLADPRNDSTYVQGLGTIKYRLSDIASALGIGKRIAYRKSDANSGININVQIRSPDGASVVMDSELYDVPSSSWALADLDALVYAFSGEHQLWITAAPPPRLELLTDDFAGEGPAEIWTVTTGAGGSVVADGALKLTLITGVGDPIAQVNSNVPYTLRGSYVAVRVDEVVAGTDARSIFRIGIDANNAFRFSYDGTSWKSARVIGGTNTDIQTGISLSLPVWLRISEAGGIIYWHSSTDGSAWTERGQWAHSNIAGLDAMSVQLQAEAWPPTGTQRFTLDKLNILP